MQHAMSIGLLTAAAIGFGAWGASAAPLSPPAAPEEAKSRAEPTGGRRYHRRHYRHRHYYYEPRVYYAPRRYYGYRYRPYRYYGRPYYYDRPYVYGHIGGPFFGITIGGW